MLDEIKKQEKEGKLEVVTYRTMYTKNADWKKPVDLGTTKYTVDFYSTDNKTLIYSATVEEGGSATAPKIETAEGVKFKKWSGSFSSVTKNICVYAICDGVKMTDDAAVGLKHEHFFLDSGEKQTCGTCGLVTKKPTVTSSPASSTASSQASSVAPSVSSSNPSQDAASKEASVSNQSSSVVAPSNTSSLSEPQQNKSGGINFAVLAGVAVATATAATLCAVLIKKLRKKDK